MDMLNYILKLIWRSSPLKCRHEKSANRSRGFAAYEDKITFRFVEWIDRWISGWNCSCLIACLIDCQWLIFCVLDWLIFALQVTLTSANRTSFRGFQIGARLSTSSSGEDSDVIVGEWISHDDRTTRLQYWYPQKSDTKVSPVNVYSQYTIRYIIQ